MCRFLTLVAVMGSALVITPRTSGQELTGEDFIHFMSPLKGSWTTTLKSDGDPVPGTVRYELAPNTRCYLTQMKGGGLPYVNGVEGYDPVAKRWTGTGFADSGEYSVSTLEWSEIKPGQAMHQGATGKQTLCLHGADGQTTTIVQTLTCQTVDQNTLVLVYTNRTANGNSLPDMVFTLRREQR